MQREGTDGRREFERHLALWTVHTCVAPNQKCVRDGGPPGAFLLWSSVVHVAESNGKSARVQGASVHLQFFLRDVNRDTVNAKRPAPISRRGP